jgi:hypothetical protein
VTCYLLELFWSTLNRGTQHCGHILCYQVIPGQDIEIDRQRLLTNDFALAFVIMFTFYSTLYNLDNQKLPLNNLEISNVPKIYFARQAQHSLKVHIAVFWFNRPFLARWNESVAYSVLYAQVAFRVAFLLATRYVWPRQVRASRRSTDCYENVCRVYC